MRRHGRLRRPAAAAGQPGRTLDAAQQEQRAELAGQFTMFDSMFDAAAAPVPVATAPVANSPVPSPSSEKEKLAWEKEVLGLYISSHPFQHAAAYLRSRVTADSPCSGRRWRARR